MSRKVRHIFFIGCAAIALLLVTLYVLMSFTRLPAQSLVYILNKSLQDRFDVRVSVAEVRGNLISGLDLRDIAVYVADNQEETASVKKAQLRYRLTSLLSGRLFFRELVLIEPVCNIDPELGRRLIRDRKEVASETEQAAQGSRFGIDRLVVRKGKFIVRLRSGMLMTWKDIDFAGKLSSDEAGMSATIDTVRGHWSEKDLAIRHAEFKAAWARDTLTVDKCAVMTGLSAVHVAGTLNTIKQLRFDFNIPEADICLDEIGRVAGLARDDLKGMVSLQASLEGNLQRFRLESEMRGSFRQYVFDRLHVQGMYSEKAFRFSTVELSMGDLHLIGPLEVSLDAPGAYSGELTFRNLDLSQIAGSLPSSELNGIISFAGRAFAAKDISVTAHIQCQNSRVHGYPVDYFKAGVTLSEQVITAEEPVVIRSGRTSGTVQGWLGLAGPVHALCQVRLGDIAAFTALFGLPSIKGTATGMAMVTGNVTNPDIDGEADFHFLSGPSFSLDSLAARVRLRHVIAGRQGSIVLSGTGGSISDIPVTRVGAHLTLGGSTIGIDSLSLWAEQAGLDLAGYVSFAGKGTDLRLDRVRGRLRGYSVSNMDTVCVRIDRNKDVSGRGRFQAGEGSFDVDGSISSRGNMQAALTMRSLNLLPLAEILHLPGGIQGLASGQLTLSGTTERPRMQLAATVTEGRVVSIPFDTLKCVVGCGEDKLVVSNVEVMSGGRPVIAGQGTIPMRLTFSGPELFTVLPDSAVHVALQVIEFDIHQVFGQLSPPLDVYGICSADITAGQTLRHPSVEVKIKIGGGRYDMLPFGDIGGKFIYQSGQLIVDYLESSYEGTEYASTGTIPFSLGWPLANPLVRDKSIDLIFGMAGNIPSGLVAMFTDKIRNITGDLDIRYYFTGALNDPVLSGDLKLKQGVLQLNELDNPITDLTATMSMSDTLLTIHKCRGTMGNGKEDGGGFFDPILRIFTGRKKEAPGAVSLRGEVNFSDLKRLGYDLQLEATNILVQPFRQDMDLLADGHVIIRGVEFPHIAGEATLVRGVVKDALRPKEPIDPQSGAGQASEKGPSLDLQVRVPGNFWIEGSDYLQEMSVELKGNLQILKRTAEPVYHFFGDAQTLRGKYQIYDNVFRITEGTISFGGIDVFDPTLNIAAETHVGSEPIYLQLAGTLLQPQISLSSESGYSEKDIITLLTLGTTTGTVDTAGVSGAFESKATSVLGSLIEGELSRRARQQLGVDTFELNSETGSQISPQETQVTVGKYLSQRMYLEYSRRLAMESEQEVELEYQLNRNLSFLGVRDHLGLYHLQLQFKFDY